MFLFVVVSVEHLYLQFILIINNMILELVRCRVSEYGTFGKLYIDDVFECYTLEPVMPVPVGVYDITLNVVSPKFKFRSPYTKHKGKVPRLLNVPLHSGILIHIGNFVKDTAGCILVGTRSSLVRLYNSTDAYLNLYKKLSSCNGKIIIKITNI